MAQTRWMLDLLLLMVPDYSEEEEENEEQEYITKISLQTLDEEAKILSEKLDYFTSYITGYISRCCHLTVKQISGYFFKVNISLKKNFLYDICLFLPVAHVT